MADAVTAAPGLASEAPRDLPARVPLRRPASLGIPVTASASASVPAQRSVSPVR
jgi:hypothetical protein